MRNLLQTAVAILAGLTLSSFQMVATSQAVAAGSCPNAPKSKSLQVGLKKQQDGLWCWAASGQMTMNYIKPGLGLKQCDIFKARYSNFEANSSVPLNCCNKPNFCSLRGIPFYKAHGFDAVIGESGTRLLWDEIVDQIACQGKPFSYILREAGGDHMVVVKGYKKYNDGRRMLKVNDPRGECAKIGGTSCNGVAKLVSYEEYVGVGYPASHVNDHYNIQYVGGP